MVRLEKLRTRSGLAVEELGQVRVAVGEGGQEWGWYSSMRLIILGGLDCHPIDETGPSPPLRSRRPAIQNRDKACF